MDILEKYLKFVSYKFPKGYPDLKNEEDILLLESLFSEMGVPILIENQEVSKIIKSSPLFKEYGNIEVKGKSTLKVYFSEIPSRGANSDTIRMEVYDKIKELVNSNPKLSNYKRESIGGSSIGHSSFELNGKSYKLIVKGMAKDTQGDTDVKEALVSFLYITDISSPFNKQNYEERLPQLVELSKNEIPGESSAVRDKVEAYLLAIEDKNVASNINFLNQSLSPAITLRTAYPNAKLIRSGIFDDIRTKAQNLTGLPADKWNPGDLYVYLGGVENISSMDNIELINDLFVDDWGKKDKPLVSISLKQEAAQGGKAKTLLAKYTKIKTDYNLTPIEIQFTSDQFVEGIEDLREKIHSLVASNPNIEYLVKKGEMKDNISFLRGKFAALKSIEFLFRQFEPGEVDDALVALVGFGMSLTGVNPTFFKLKGQRSGGEAEISEFERGQNVSLYHTDEGYDPITIEDVPTFGGLKIDFTIEKGGDPFSISINARNNGNTQGTLEIQKIKPI